MALALENVSKVVQGETHIYPTDLECAPGSFNVLLGLTRSGKTSLMRLMAGLDQPTRGRIRMDGVDVTGVPVRKRNVAMVYQQFINYPSMNCFDNIASPLRLLRLSRPEIDQRVRREAERLHIEHLLDRMPAELSGGQQQRLAMARALVRDASLLLLDEPLVNLDYKLREELRAEMREIFAEREAIVVYATTDPLEALTLGGSAAVLHQGRLVQYGPTAAVYHRPCSVPVTQVFSDPPMNLLRAEVADGELRLAGEARLPLPSHFRDLAPGPVTVGIRPPHVMVTPRREDTLALHAEVEVAEVSGSETYVHLNWQGSGLVAQEEGVHPFAIGERIQVYVDPRHLFAFGADEALLVSPTARRADRAAEH